MLMEMRGFTQFPELNMNKKRDLGLQPKQTEESDSEDEIYNLLPHQRQQKYNVKKMTIFGFDIPSSEWKGAVAMVLIVLWVSTVALIVMTAFGEFKAESKTVLSRGTSDAVESLKSNNVVLRYSKAYSMDDTIISANDIEGRNNNISYRLPTDIIPVHYHLSIQVNMHKLKYSGYISITIKIQKNTSKIVLHYNEHNTVVKAELVHNDHGIEQLKSERDAKRQFLVLQTYHKLRKGELYRIGLHFQGDIKKQFSEFCLNSYKTREGKPEYLAFTDFEPISARNVFPCFDEPELKATFKIVITHDKEYKAISNMPVTKSVRVHPGKHPTQEHKETPRMMTYFQETPRISTYLVAFAVTKYTYIETKTKRNKPVRIYVNKGKIHMAKFASSIALKCVNYFETILKTPFPLPKLDILAIPEKEVGEENWGLITLSNRDLLYDPKISDPYIQEDVALSIAHEISHQWFGDLVTMKWWSDIWLKEGFAFYLEKLSVNHLYPEWKIMETFYHTVTSGALMLDALSSSHPVWIDVRSPPEINSVFDSITYLKGASLVRMLVVQIGGYKFHNGLKSYFKKYKYGNANSSDLLNALNKETTSINLRKMMDTWIYQQGYPVVTISHNEENSVLVAKQDIFMISKKKLPISPYGYKWDIPLRYVRQWYPRNIKHKWLKMKSAKFPWRGKPGWFIFNHGHTGFYRVNYEEKNWKALIKQLNVKHKALSTVDRAGLIDDSFNLARAGLLNYSMPLDLSQYLEKEIDYVPWCVAFDIFNYLEEMLSKRKNYHCFKQYLIELLHPLNKLLGWKDKGSHLQRKLRQMSLAYAVNLGDRRIVKKAKELFKKWKKSSDRYSVPASLRYTVYLAGIKYGTKRDWDFVWKMYQKEDNKQERLKFLTALGQTSDPELLQRYLSYMLNMKKISLSEAPFALHFVASTTVGKEKIWNFIQKNWNVLHKRYAELNSVIKRSIGSFSDEQKLNEVKEFFNTHPAGAYYLVIKQSIELIEQNMDFLRKFEGGITNWLKSRKKCHVKPDSNERV